MSGMVNQASNVLLTSPLPPVQSLWSGSPSRSSFRQTFYPNCRATRSAWCRRPPFVSRNHQPRTERGVFRPPGITQRRWDPRQSQLVASQTRLVVHSYASTRSKTLPLLHRTILPFLNRMHERHPPPSPFLVPCFYA